MSKREFVEDKVYLKTPDGNIWEYEPLLAKRSDVKKVIPNRSKKAAEPPPEQEVKKEGEGEGGTQTNNGTQANDNK